MALNTLTSDVGSPTRNHQHSICAFIKERAPCVNKNLILLVLQAKVCHTFYREGIEPNRQRSLETAE